jgi:hypothetical protein
VAAASRLEAEKGSFLEGIAGEGNGFDETRLSEGAS